MSTTNRHQRAIEVALSFEQSEGHAQELSSQHNQCCRRTQSFSALGKIKAIARLGARGKKFFVTSNLIAHNDKIRTYLRAIEPVIECTPDALLSGRLQGPQRLLRQGCWAVF